MQKPMPQPQPSSLTIVPPQSHTAQPALNPPGGVPLYGHYGQSLDATGRVLLPPAFRASIGDAGVLTHSPAGCLWLFAEATWQHMLEHLWAATLRHDPAQRTRRMLCVGARHIECASDGTLALPRPLCVRAAISEVVVFVGMDIYIEVWAVHRWVQKQQADVA